MTILRFFTRSTMSPVCANPCFSDRPRVTQGKEHTTGYSITLPARRYEAFRLASASGRSNRRCSTFLRQLRLFVAATPCTQPFTHAARWVKGDQIDPQRTFNPM